MSESDPNPKPPKPAKDPASVEQLDRIENTVGEINKKLKKGEDPPPQTPPKDLKRESANDGDEDDEPSDYDKHLFGGE